MFLIKHSKYLLTLGLLVSAGCSPNNAQLLLNQSKGLINENQYHAAQILLEQVIAENPNTDEATKAKAELFFVTKRLQKEFDNRMSDTERSMTKIVGAVERYRTDKKKLPATLKDLYPYYLNPIPLDGWGHPFFYTQRVESAKYAYRVFSFGARSKPIPLDQLDPSLMKDALTP